MFTPKYQQSSAKFIISLGMFFLFLSQVSGSPVQPVSERQSSETFFVQAKLELIRSDDDEGQKVELQGHIAVNGNGQGFTNIEQNIETTFHPAAVIFSTTFGPLRELKSIGGFMQEHDSTSANNEVLSVTVLQEDIIKDGKPHSVQAFGPGQWISQLVYTVFVIPAF